MSVYDNLVGMEEVLDEFIVETTELLEEVNEDLVHLEANPDDEILNRIFRAFHTFKGTCGFLGFGQAKDLAHVAEDLLNQMRNGKLSPNGTIIDLLLEASDWFGQFINDVKEREEKVYDIDSLSSRIVVAREASSDAVEASVEQVTEAPADEVSANGHTATDEEPSDGLAAAGELSENGIVATADLSDIERKTLSEIFDLLEQAHNDFADGANNIADLDIPNFISHLLTVRDLATEINLTGVKHVADRLQQYLSAVQAAHLIASTMGNEIVLQCISWMKSIISECEKGTIADQVNSELVESISAVITAPESSPVKNAQAKDKKSDKGSSVQTIRVDMERLENLMNLAGELVLNRNQLGQAYNLLSANMTGDSSIDNLDQVNNSLGRITTDIQEAVMQMRMLPISNVFRKFPRVIRDLSRERGKSIELVMIGEDTELDRSVIEAISDPLLHLVRNAADHGIESPEIRKAHGKPEKGTLTLSAAHEGNHIVIEVVDDGAGMDADMLARKAVEKGVITSSEAEALSYRDKLNLIFRPGFSTAAKVTDVSGRGVGMDVVSTNVSRLNGAIDIDTKIGEGTKIKIKLPLTLAIVTGLKVAVWDEEYIIPFGSIIETVKLDEKDLTKVEDKWVIRFRDSVIHTLYLDDLFKVKTTQEEGHQQEFYAVVVAMAEFRYALIVTGLKGQEEAVIKPLGQLLGRIPGIAGGTIGGDGRITLILDIPELIHNIGLG